MHTAVRKFFFQPLGTCSARVPFPVALNHNEERCRVNLSEHHAASPALPQYPSTRSCVAVLWRDDGAGGRGEELDDALLSVVEGAECLLAVVEHTLDLLGGRVVAGGSATRLFGSELLLLE